MSKYTIGYLSATAGILVYFCPSLHFSLLYFSLNCRRFFTSLNAINVGLL